MSEPATSPVAMTLEPREAYSEPLQRRTPDGTVNPLLEHAVLGVACATRTLLVCCMRPGWLPGLINERVMPLCDIDSPLVSFIWAELHPDLDFPPVAAINDFVTVLAERLHMTVNDLVLAYVLFEKVIIAQRSTLRSFTVRPLLVAASVLAVKISSDEVITTADCFAALEADFTALDSYHLTDLMTQLLIILGYRIPSGPIYQTYADALFAASNDLTGDSQAAPKMLCDDVCAPESPAGAVGPATAAASSAANAVM